MILSPEAARATRVNTGKAFAARQMRQSATPGDLRLGLGATRDLPPPGQVVTEKTRQA